MDDPGDKPRPRDESIEELDALLQDPERWAAIEPDKLRHLLFYESLSYGIEPDDSAIPTLIGLHKVAVERLHPAVRRDLVAHLAGAIDRVHREHSIGEGAGCTNALLPFLLEDPDPAVVSRAASELALLLPTEDGDPLTGPRYVRSLVEQVRGDDARAGIIAGLLELGDARLAPLVAGAWSALGEEGRQTLALLIQAFHGLHPLAVEFLLSWLEDEARQPLARSFGVVAATLARAGRHAAEHGVSDMRRTFPITDAPEREPYVVTQEWTLDAFAPSIAERLMRVAADEHPPVLMPHVLSYWGFAEAAYRLAASAAAAGARATATDAGVCEPVRLELVPDWPEDPERETLIEWGILNPLGPTVNALRLTPVASGCALVYTVYHPRATAAHVTALLPASPGGVQVAAAVHAVMERNGDGGMWLVRSLPDYVHVPRDSPLEASDVARAFEAARSSSLAAGEDAVDLRAHAARLGRLAADPWGTIAGEIDSSRDAGDSAREGSEGAQPRVTREGDAGPSYHEWLRIAGAPAHVASIRAQIPIAWQRAGEEPGREPSPGN